MSLALDGQALSAGDYELVFSGLVIGSVPQCDFTLEIVTFCNPKEKLSSPAYICLRAILPQCEAVGFRRIRTSMTA